MLTGEKSVFLSKGFWGSVAVILLGALPMLGVDASDLGIGQAQLAEWLYQAAVLGGGVLALVGRVMAKKQVKVS